MSTSVCATIENERKTKMNISKLKLAWKFITGGREGVLDYVLDIANTFTNRIADAKKEELKDYLATARRILGALDSISWLCPASWLHPYTLTVGAFADLVAALEDLKITREELTAVCNAFQLAYAAWRAE